jgi:hypothetical protein
VITGDGANNVINGGAGNDALNGGAGLDTLSFEGSVPHGPERLLQMPIQFLAIIHYEATE